MTDFSFEPVAISAICEASPAQVFAHIHTPADSAMSHSIAADLVQAVQTILDQHSPMEGPITKWGKVLDVVKSHKLA